MILDSMAWFDERELKSTGFSFITDTGLILRAKKGSDQFGWGEKEDIVMSEKHPTEPWWGVPRAWPEVVKYQKEGKDHNNGIRFKEVPKKYKYTGPELRKDQEECVQQAYEHLTVSEGWQSFFPGGILMAPAGTGKTLMALDLVARLGQKALIIVHNEVLRDQWKEQIEKCLALEIASGNAPLTPGVIQGGTCECNFDIVVGMVQTLSSKELICGAYKEFGVVIVDEVHRLGATEWHKAIKHFPARYRIGLTATPKRADGFADVFKWHIGPVMARLESPRMIPKIVFKTHNSGLKQAKYTWKKKINLGRLITALSKREGRNERIARLADFAIKAGRKPLILSDRVDQVVDIRDKLTAKGHAIAAVYGGQKMKIGPDMDGTDAVVGTYQMMKEGIDIPRLDTLIYATPKVDIVQAVGRIQRDHPDKKEPMVVDLIDENLPVFVGFAESRRKRYIEEYGEDCIIEPEPTKKEIVDSIIGTTGLLPQDSAMIMGKWEPPIKEVTS